MPPLAPGELEAVLEAAAPETVAGFLGDLEEARGRPVERVGERTLLVGADRERVVVAGGAADGGGAAEEGSGTPDDWSGADRVVVAGRPVDADAVEGRAVDAGALADALLYAVDRSTAEDLLDRWFDRSLDEFEGSDGTATRPAVERSGTPQTDAGRPADGPASSDASRPELSTGQPLVLAGVVVLVAVVALAAWSGGVVPSAGPATPAEAGAPTPSAGADALGDDPPANPGFATPRTDGSDGRAAADGEAPASRLPPDVNASAAVGALPPGVNISGDIDERELLAAHEALLRNRSYRVSVSYREFVNGTETGVFTQSVDARNATSRRVETTQLGRFAGTPPRLASGNGGEIGVGFRAADARWEEASLTTRDPLLADLLRYLQYYLSVESSRIADVRPAGDRSLVRLTTDGDPWQGVENASGSAVVTGEGLVRQVRRTYDRPGSPVRVVVVVRVHDVGWADESAAGTPAGAANGSAAGTPAGAANGSPPD
jgi:hypothetical protein